MVSSIKVYMPYVLSNGLIVFDKATWTGCVRPAPGAHGTRSPVLQKHYSIGVILAALKEYTEVDLIAVNQ